MDGGGGGGGEVPKRKGAGSELHGKEEMLECNRFFEGNCSKVAACLKWG
jgi:hypothetical protein